MARTKSTRGRLPRFLSESHLKRWLREHPRGQSILHELTCEATANREPVLIVVGTYMNDWKPHTLVRCYAGPAVRLKLIQTQHVGHGDDEPLADQYAEVLARKWYPGRALLDEYGCLPNRPQVEYVVRKRTADDMLRTKWQLQWLEALPGLPRDGAAMIVEAFPELLRGKD